MKINPFHFWQGAVLPDLSPTSTVLLSAPDQPNLSIAAGTLTEGASYTFRLTVTTTNPTGISYGDYTVTINEPPLPGSFGMSATSGAQFITTFTLEAFDWVYVLASIISLKSR